MANIWQGRLIRLRAVEPDDWQAFFDWDSETTDDLRDTYSLDWPMSREAHKKWAVDRALGGAKDEDFRWIIETLDGAFVGTINTDGCDPRCGTLEYGIAILREHRHKGYAAEAVCLVLAYYFRERRYQKCTVHVYAYNEPSLAFHRRLGFQEEGRLRRTAYSGGKYHDEIVFGMTVEEFERLHLSDV